jgi:maltooligosyltrehalose trehalohydrolase
MSSAPGGWWTRTEAAKTPVRYAFSIDGGDPRPDPRAPRLPAGVHGPAETFEPEGFGWSDAGFRAVPLGNGLVYELHVGTFTREGTFEAVIGRLDYLRGLGVTHVELMPVASFPGRYGWGYDGVGLFAPHEPYGGPDGLCRLIDACHARDLAVIIDVVYNHLGPEGNYLAEFGPYFTDRHHTPWGDAVNLDGPESDEVRRFFLDNASMWLRDYHADGLRLDAIHALTDTSAIHFLEELAEETDKLEAETGRPLVLIAESDLNDPRVIRPRAAHGLGMHAQWTDDFHHALHARLTGERQGYYADFGSLDHVAKSLERAFVVDGSYSRFRRRRHGRPPGGASGRRFVVYGQTHDQVGNRAAGDRIGHLVSAGRVRVLAALVLTSPFVPMLFMGEEWAASSPFQFFADFEDEGLRTAVSEGRRCEFAAFGWEAADVPDPIDPETFVRSRLDWSELVGPGHAEVLAWYRRLIALRRALPELTDGRLDAVRVTADDAQGTLVVERGRVTIAVNVGDRTASIDRPDGALALAYPDDIDPAAAPLTLPPDSVAVFTPVELV